MGDRRRVLVIGVGSIGKRHVRCFTATGRAEVSICELDERLRTEVGDECGVAARFASLDDALQQDFDAAVICTPAHLHIDMAIEVVRRNMHVLIEKPLGTSLDHLEQLKREVTERKRVAGVAYVIRHHPGLRAVKQAIDEGRFGTPLQIVATGGQHFPTHRPAYREIYYTDRRTGGGAIQDAITHTLNAGEWIVGPIERVAADADHQQLPGVTVEDTVHVLTRQAGAMGSYSLNQFQSPNESTLTIACEQGSARFEAHLMRWRWTLKPEEPWRDEPLGEIPRDSLFVTQANAFLDCLDGAGEPSCSLEEGEQTLKVNLAVLRAADTRSWQDV